MSPTIVFSAIALGVAGFLATSGDNFVILLGLYGGRTYRSRDVLVGYVGAIGLVVVAARLFAVVAHQAPPGIVGYLGVIPLGPGSWFRIPESGGRSVGSRRTSCRSS
jgi:cadmium resistance protein CadD (predicted permease)